MTILCIRLSALGDVAMTIPAIYSCAVAHPDHRFLVLTTTFCGRLFVGSPENVELLCVDGVSMRGVAGTLRLLRMLCRVDGIGCVADLHNVLRSWIIDAFMAVRGKRVRMLDKMRSERKAILTSHASASRPYVQRYFDVFARLGLACQPLFTAIPSSALPSVASLPADLSAASLPASVRKIGIAPFARYANKTYPSPQTERLLQLLAGRGDAEVYLFGSRGAEAEALSRWAASSERLHVVAGRLSLEQELRLMSLLDVMLTMDSANMHLASLVGTRVVSLWGSTTPSCGFLGFGQKSDDALMAGLSCQPCTTAGSSRCPLATLDCMRQLSPESVAEALMR